MFCSKCKTEKDEGSFPPSLRRGKTGTCRECHRKGVIGWTKNNKESFDEYRRNWAKTDREKRYEYFREHERKRTLKKYGVNQVWYDTRLAEQQNLCAICGKPESRQHHARNKQVMLLSVDHNHQTGAVRGLLCQHCNRTLYRLEDNQWLEKATQYLKKYEGASQ